MKVASSITRRFALFGIGRTAAVTAVVVASPIASTPAKETGPLTPAQYIHEMLAIEARPIAGFTTNWTAAFIAWGATNTGRANGTTYLKTNTGGETTRSR